MSVTIPPGFASAAIEVLGSAGTAPYITTFGVDTSEAGGDFLKVANECFDCYASNWQLVTSDQLTINRCILSVGQDGGEAPSVISDLSSRVGNRSGASEHIGTALLINKNTATLGRRGRGRMFIPGVLADSQVSLEGRLNASQIDLFQEIADQFGQQLQNGVPGTSIDDWIPLQGVLLHGPVDGIDPSPITSFPVQSKVGMLRRRLR